MTYVFPPVVTETFHLIERAVISFGFNMIIIGTVWPIAIIAGYMSVRKVCRRYRNLSRQIRDAYNLVLVPKPGTRLYSYLELQLAEIREDCCQYTDFEFFEELQRRAK